MEDGVWASIAPETGRLPRRVSRGLLLLAGVLVLALGAGAFLARHGAFRAQVTVVTYGWDGEFVEPDGRTRPAIAAVGLHPGPVVRLTVGVESTGWSDARVIGVRLVGSGFLELQWGSEHQTGAVDLPAGESRRLSLLLRITDCATAAAPQVVIMIDSWRGEQTAVLALPVVVHHHGGWHVTTAADPAAMSPVRYLADMVCPLA